MLPGRKPLLDHGRMGIVAGGDDQGVDGGIGKKSVRVRGGRGKAELLAQMRAGYARAGGYGRKARAPGLLHGRKQHPARIATRPDHADDRRSGGHGLLRPGQVDGAAHVHLVRGIGQDNADIRLRIVRDHVVGFFRVFDGKAMGDERAHVDLARGHQIKDRLEIALFGPAHIGERIVPPLVLVTGIIPARPIGTRHLKGQLLFKEDGAGQLQARHAHKHDAATLAAHGRALQHRLRRFGGRRDDHPVHAATMAESICRLDGVFTPGQVHGLRTKGTRQGAFGGVKINAQHLAAIGHQNLNRKQPDKPEARDHEIFAQGRLGQTDALQRNGPDHGEGCGLIGNRIRNARAQIGRNRHHFCMVPIADHPIPNLETRGQRGPDLRDAAHVAVAQGQGGIELGEDGINGRHEAVGLDLVDDHFDLVGLLPGLLQVVALAEVDEHALGSGGDKGGRGFYEELMTGRQGAGFVDQFGGAVFEILEDLFQVLCSLIRGNIFDMKRMRQMSSSLDSSTTNLIIILVRLINANQAFSIFHAL